MEGVEYNTLSVETSPLSVFTYLEGPYRLAGVSIIEAVTEFEDGSRLTNAINEVICNYSSGYDKLSSDGYHKVYVIYAISEVKSPKTITRITLGETTITLK